MNAKLFLTPIAALPLCACTGDGSGDDLPNIIFIVADDLGYGDLSCMGQERFSTPNIDSLASEGILFTRHYAGSSVSAPSRSALLTGLHTGHTPVRGNMELPVEGQYPLPGNCRTVLRLVKEYGYTTGVFGKWGLGGPGTEGAPEVQGVNEFYGYNCQRMAHNYYPDHLWHNGEMIVLEGNAGEQEEEYAPELIHNQALKFIRENTAQGGSERVTSSRRGKSGSESSSRRGKSATRKPFFMMYTSVIPHAELRLPEEEIRPFIGKFEPDPPYLGCDDGPNYKKGGYGSQEHPHAAFAAMVTVLDRQVGEIVRAVREAGIEDNTLIIFTSDNGPHIEGGADPYYFNSNGGLRGIKRDLYEGGIRVPFIAKWPGKIVAGTRTDHISAFWDFMATVADIIGADLPEGRSGDGQTDRKDGTDGNLQAEDTAGSRLAEGSDGISYLPTLTGRGKQQTHDYLYWEFHESGGRQAVLKGDWKAVRYNIAGKAARVEDNNRNGGWGIELYNLAEDPAEQHDIAAQHPEVVQELAAIMKEARTPAELYPFPE